MMKPKKARRKFEIVFSPGSGKFSGQAECNMLVALDDTSAARRLAQRRTLWWPISEMPAPQRLREVLPARTGKRIEIGSVMKISNLKSQIAESRISNLESQM